MQFSLLVAALVFLVSGVVSTAVERGLQPKICPQLPVKEGGCIRCNSFIVDPANNVIDVRGFDVTGVTTEIDLTFPEIKNECDCIKACLDYKTTCNNYVWKFSTPESVKSGYRTCTLCITPLALFRRPADSL